MTTHKTHLRELSLRVYQDNDFNAFGEIYRLLAPRLELYLQRQLDANPQEAEEIVMDVLIRCWKKMQLQPIPQINNYLHRAVRNALFNRQRDRNRHLVLHKQARSDSTPPEYDPGYRLDPLKQATAIEQVLYQLSPDHREILKLRFWEDLACCEIAELLEIKLGTVTSRLARAKEAFQSLAPPHLKNDLLS